MVDDFVAADVAQSRMTRLTEVVERHALARHEARVGRVEEVLVEGPSKKDPTKASGRTRQNKLVHFAADGRGRAPGYLRDRSRSPAPRRTGCAASWSRSWRRRPHRACASRSPPAEIVTPTHPPDPLALVGPTASGKSALALDARRAARRRRDRLGRLDAALPRSRHRDREADGRRARARPAPPARRRRADRGLVRRAVPGRGPRRGRRHRSARRRARCSSAAPACTCTRSSTTSASPARTSRSGPRLDARADRARRSRPRSTPSCESRDPVAAGAHRARHTGVASCVRSR